MKAFLAKATMAAVIGLSLGIGVANAQFPPQFPLNSPVFGPVGRSMLDVNRGIVPIHLMPGKALKIDFASNAHWQNRLILYDDRGVEVQWRDNYYGGMHPIELRNISNQPRMFYLTSWAKMSKPDAKRPWSQTKMRQFDAGIWGVCEGGAPETNPVAFRAVMVRVWVQ